MLLLMLALAAACQPVTAEGTSGDSEMRTIRYLALGDSYTIGESVMEADRWPHQLARQLGADGVQVELTIIARTGWTVDELWQGMQASPPEGIYDLVTLLVGVNNQYRGYPVAGYRQEFQFMLGKAIDYAGGEPGKVIVLSIPDWGITPFAAGRDSAQIAAEIDAFNAVNRDEATSAGVHYVDVTAISRMASRDPELIAGDGLHPSGKMYALWAEAVLPLAREMVE